MPDRAELAITPATKVAELLEAFPELEEVLIALAPAFERLRNPVLRRTVARVASLQQAAAVGGVEVRTLVATLRRAAGQPGADLAGQAAESRLDEPAPAWLDEGRVVTTIDADALLDAGEVPLSRVNAAAAALAVGEILRVDSGFRPAPLVDALLKQGYRCHLRSLEAERFSTYVCRGPMAPEEDRDRGAPGRQPG